MIVFILVLAGFLLRIYNLENWAGFDYDQRIAAWWIKSLLIDQKFSLIGQEISLGGIFAGPFYFYFLTPFYWLFKMNPIAANVAVSLVSIITLILIYKVSKLMFGKTAGIVSLFLYAFSSSINFYDRTTASSNLLMVLSLLTIYLLFWKGNNLIKWLGLGIIGGFSFSVPPTAMFLIPQTTLYLLVKRKVNKFFLIFISFIFLGLLPLIIFDFRHGHILIQRLFGVAVTVPEFKLLFNIQTLVKMWWDIIFPLGFLGPFFLWWLIKVKADKILWLIWVGVPLIILSVYRYHVPEYYFLPVIPLIIILTAAFLTSLPKMVYVCLLVIFCLINIYYINNFTYGVSMEYKKQAVKYIISPSNNFAVKYNCDPGLNNGYDYLFYFFQNEPKVGGKDGYIIVSPANRTRFPGKIFGNIKVIKNE